MRIVAGQAITACDRWMDQVLREVRLVMAHEAEVRDRRYQRKRTLLLCMRSRVARFAALLHAGILSDSRMDRAFRDDLFMAINAGLRRGGCVREGTHTQAHEEGSQGISYDKHATCYRTRRNKSTKNTKKPAHYYLHLLLTFP